MCCFVYRSRPHLGFNVAKCAASRKPSGGSLCVVTARPRKTNYWVSIGQHQYLLACALAIAMQKVQLAKSSGGFACALKPALALKFQEESSRYWLVSLTLSMLLGFHPHSAARAALSGRVHGQALRADCVGTHVCSAGSPYGTPGREQTRVWHPSQCLKCGLTADICVFYVCSVALLSFVGLLCQARSLTVNRAISRRCPKESQNNKRANPLQEIRRFPFQPTQKEYPRKITTHVEPGCPNRGLPLTLFYIFCSKWALGLMGVGPEIQSMAASYAQIRGEPRDQAEGPGGECLESAKVVCSFSREYPTS